MVIVMKPGSTGEQVEHVCQLVREMGLRDHVIVGTERTVVAVIGDDRFKDRSVLETVEGVEKVVPILAPYKMASIEVQKERTIVPLMPSGDWSSVSCSVTYCFSAGSIATLRHFCFAPLLRASALFCALSARYSPRRLPALISSEMLLTLLPSLRAIVRRLFLFLSALSIERRSSY
jgi:hypothetical protein